MQDSLKNFPFCRKRLNCLIFFPPRYKPFWNKWFCEEIPDSVGNRLGNSKHSGGNNWLEGFLYKADKPTMEFAVVERVLP